MTLGFIRETAIDRWCGWVAERPLPPVPDRPAYRCPFCGEGFGSQQLRLDHLDARHKGDRPLLLLGGAEPPRVTRVRRVLAAGDVVVRNATAIRARFDGGPCAILSPDRLAEAIAGVRRRRAEIMLSNTFDPMAQPIRQEYVIDIRAPDRETLARIDRRFMEHLARPEVDFEAVSRFIDACPGDAEASDYVEALAAYVRGILVKDRPYALQVTLPVGEWPALYGQARAVLSEYRRPVADLVCGAIALALNDFAHERPTGDAGLDRLRAALVPLAGGVPVESFRSGTLDAGAGGRRAVAPIDGGLARLLQLHQRLSGGRAWTPALAEECLQASSAEHLDARDHAKALALWAQAALAAGQRLAAREPLAALAATYPFGDWASDELGKAEA